MTIANLLHFCVIFFWKLFLRHMNVVLICLSSNIVPKHGIGYHLNNNMRWLRGHISKGTWITMAVDPCKSLQVLDIIKRIKNMIYMPLRWVIW